LAGEGWPDRQLQRVVKIHHPKEGSSKWICREWKTRLEVIGPQT